MRKQPITALCIGGVKDGETVTVLHGRSFMEFRPQSVENTVRLHPGPCNVEQVALDKDIYRIIEFRTDQGSVQMWVLSTMTVHDAMLRLLQSHKKVQL